MNKKTVVPPILAIIVVSVLLFGSKMTISKVAAENVVKERNEMMMTLLPGSASFVAEEFEAAENTAIKSVYKADNGFVIESTAYGYSGDITVMVGVSNEGKVTGLVVRDLKETKGLGANALTDTTFLAQFLGTDGEAAIGTDIDALSGATVSSKAVTKAVNSAVAYVTGADTSSSATEWGG